jgi:hypothetical protein
MTRPEFLTWIEFYKLFPFDDRYRYHRPAALISHAIAGGDIDLKLEWLQPEHAAPAGNYSAADLATMKAFGVKPPR